MPRRRRWRQLFLWGVIFVSAVMAGALGFAYTYMTDSSTLVALINARLPEFLPGSQIRADRAMLKPMLGQFDLRNVTLIQPVDDRAFATIRIPWLQIKCDMKALWKGQVQPREISVAQPSLRLTRMADGRWNVQGLLADPWPDTPQFKPRIRISKGVLELVDGPLPPKVLHDVELTFDPDEEVEGMFHFEGSGQGDAFDRFSLAGTLDTLSGSVALERGEISGLTISESLRHRLPPDWQESWDAVGLNSGRLDVVLEHFSCARSAGRPLSYAVRLGLREGTWNCEQLPFPLSEVSGVARVENGRVDVSWAEARYGKTLVRVHSGAVDLNESNPADGRLDLDFSVTNLDLDAKLRAELPPDLQRMWDDFTPTENAALGRISLRARVSRAFPGEELAYGATIDLLDVALSYDQFPFPLEHVRGRLKLQHQTLEILYLQTLVGLGGQPLTASGRIEHLGPDPEVTLDFEAAAMPIDEDGLLIQALPPDLRSLVCSFHPRGTVRGTARVHRRQIGSDHSDDPMAGVEVHSTLDLNPDSSMRWDGLPYPVRRLTGRLELDPRGCTFTNMAGENGTARIEAHGRVDSTGPTTFSADVTLHADRLPFNQELREALPPEWRATWGLLNPVGTSTVDAHITAGQKGQADQTELKLHLSREDEVGVKLSLLPVPGTPGAEPGRRIELPAMQGVTGDFVFNNGPVSMTGVEFRFREAPVRFRSGLVNLRDTGQFDLRVEELRVRKLRLDSELRAIMPPLMAQFAERLGEAHPLAFKTNLSIAWNGNAADPAVCSWDEAQVLFQDNSILAGVPLEHIQGSVINGSGHSDGRSLEFAGQLQIDSVIVADQQLTNLTTPLMVREGKATVADAAGQLLGGTVRGQMEMTLAATPEYRGWAELIDADLTRFTQTVQGRQSLGGRVSARVELSGAGSDMRRLNGTGSAQLVQGDLGKLPWFLRLVAPLNLSRGNTPAFDAANLVFVVKDGEFQLDPIKITGNTISLYGNGTIKSPNEIDLEFKPLYGRDERLHIPGLSDATREMTGQMVRIHATGALSYPRIDVEVLPGASRSAAGILRRFSTRDILNPSERELRLQRPRK